MRAIQARARCDMVVRELPRRAAQESDPDAGVRDPGAKVAINGGSCRRINTAAQKAYV